MTEFTSSIGGASEKPSAASRSTTSSASSSMLGTYSPSRVARDFGSHASIISFGDRGLILDDAGKLALVKFSPERYEPIASWTVGGGLKWFLQEHVGLKGQARYKPTELNDTSSNVCSPFGFCQGSLKNLEFAGGVVFRF